MMLKYPPIIKQFPHMLHGGDYNPEQWRNTREIWQEDMRLAKLAHCNTLSVGIFSWVSLEPEEGRYDFTWLDEVMDMLTANGMVAVLATPSGSKPAWLSQKYPEVCRVNSSGQREQHGGRHNHCFTSSVYREKVARINTLLAERYRDHPALGLWHLSNEYSGECHCELCREAFLSWLKKRYTSLEELNHAWWTAFWSHTYTDWSQIAPPSMIGETSIYGLTLDWKRFVTDQTVDFMKAEMEPLRRITPGVPCTTNMMEFFDGLNYACLANEIDVISWDSYPYWHSDENDVNIAIRTSMCHDMFRCLKDGRPFMLMESTPSVTNWQPVAKLRRPGVVMLNGLQAVAHGSDTVQYFQFRKSRGGAEKLHGAVIDHEGSEHTRVFGEVAATGEVLMKLDDIVGASKPSEVALIYDVENRWALNTVKGLRYDNKYLQTVQDHYAPFWKMGVSVDVVDSTKDISRYKLVIAPMLYMLRPGMAEKIKQFVKDGGTFVTTYISGWADGHDLSFLGGFPGPLKEVLGVWCEEVDCLHDEERRAVRWQDKEYLAREFCEIAHLVSAEMLAEYEEDFYTGSPVVTENRYSQGKAYYVAARMDEEFQMDFMRSLVEELEITRPFEDDLPAGCTAQVRTDGESEFVFIMNFAPAPAYMDIGEGGVSMTTGERLFGENELPEQFAEIIKRKAHNFL